MARRRGSRSSRGVDTSKSSAKLMKAETVTSAEAIRLAVIAWMDETVENERLAAATREEFVENLRRKEHDRQARIDASRHVRITQRKYRIAERRRRVQKPVRPVVRDLLKPTGLPVKHTASFRVVDGKVESTVEYEQAMLKLERDVAFGLCLPSGELIGEPSNAAAGHAMSGMLTLL